MDELWSSRHLGNWTNPLVPAPADQHCSNAPALGRFPKVPTSGEGSLTLPTMTRCRHRIRLPRPAGECVADTGSCEESPPGGKKDCFVACASRNDRSQQKGPRK